MNAGEESNVCTHGGKEVKVEEDIVWWQRSPERNTQKIANVTLRLFYVANFYHSFCLARMSLGILVQKRKS